MSVLGFKIKLRFFLIVGSVFALLIAGLWLKGQQPAPYDPLTQPAFEPAKLSKMENNWIDPYISFYGLRDPETVQPIATLSQNLGTPFRFRVLLPAAADAAARPDLNLVKYGWKFQPAVFLPPTEPIQDESQVSEKLRELEEGSPIMIGFPRGETPTEGGFYEITGLLYWHSMMLKGPSDQGYATAPVVLAASARSLNAVELTAPATHRANLNITYRQAGMQLTLKNVEWASGKQVRMCISVTNISNRIGIDPWAGIGGFRATFDQASGQASTGGEADEYSPLGQADLMSYLSPITGYIIFEAPPAADPDQRMQIFVPTLGAATGAPTIVTVEKNQFRELSTQTHSVRAGTDEGCFQPQ